MTVAGFDFLDITTSEGVAEVLLQGPRKGNAMGPLFFKEMPLAFAELDRDDSVRAVIVRGAGTSFSYGLDLKEMMADLGPLIAGPQLAKGRTALLDLIVELQKSTSCVAECRKPVISAISGWCIGGGLDLAAACDVRLCSKDAMFSLREVRVAMVADLGSLQRLPAIIGEGATRELALTGADIDAGRAHRLGLVNEVFDDADALVEGARAMAATMASNPPLVVQGIKRVMNRRTRRDQADDLEAVAIWNAAFLQSMDLTEAFTAFVQKREPVFKGQ